MPTVCDVTGGRIIKKILFILAAGLAVAGCESSPFERRQTQAVRSPMGITSTEREILGSDAMSVPFIMLEGPQDKADTVHVKPLGIEMFPSTAPAKGSPSFPTDRSGGTIDLKPTGTPPPMPKE